MSPSSSRITNARPAFASVVDDDDPLGLRQRRGNRPRNLGQMFQQIKEANQVKLCTERWRVHVPLHQVAGCALVGVLQALCEQVQAHDHAQTASFDNGPKAVMSDRPIHLIGDGVEWHHAVMSYDGATKSLNIYVDGTPTDPKRARSSTGQIDQADHIIPASEGVPLTIGGLIERAGQFQVFDELAIWSRPLTLEDARALYNNGHGVEIKPAAYK